MGLRLQLMSQQPDRLAKATLEAIFTNRSMLASHKVGADSAKRLGHEWGDAIAPATITRLPAHHFIAQITLHGQVSQPFLVRGFDIAHEEPWRSWHHPELVDRLDRRIDSNLQRRPVADILTELDSLDERIVEHLHRRRPGRAGNDPFAAPEVHPTRRGSGRAVDLVVINGGNGNNDGDGDGDDSGDPD
jgi:hypothetical protein